MNEEQKFDLYIADKIIKENSLGITGLTMIESKGDYRYSTAVLDEIRIAIESKKPLPLAKSIKSEDLREYLYIYFIEDQMARQFFVIFYDSDELWQDTEIVEILSVTGA